MNTCARCGNREQFDQDYYSLCSDCYQRLADDGVATENLPRAYGAWRRFIEEYMALDRDEQMDFLDSKTFWDFAKDSLMSADRDTVFDFLRKQIDRMAE